MSDKKISSLTSAATVTTADVFPLVQSGQTLKCSISTLLANLPAMPTANVTPETLTAAGAVSTAVPYTELSVSGTGAAFTLAAGTNGMTKIICNVSATTAYTCNTLTVTNGRNISVFTFSDGANGVGEWIYLKNVNGYWYAVASSTADVFGTDNGIEQKSSGALSAVLPMTELVNGGAGTTFTLPAPTTGTSGMTKIIACTTNTASTNNVVAVTNGRGFSYITFNTTCTGQFAQLTNVAGYWYAQVGSKGVVTLS